MAELSNRQWRALAQACPFYAPVESNGSHADCHAGPTQSDVTSSCAPSHEAWLQEVVPRVAKAFPDPIGAYRQRLDAVSGGGGGGGDGGEADTRSAARAAAAVDAVLRFFFTATHSMVPSQATQDVKRRATAALCFAEAGLLPLNARELQLLRLYQRKQEQYAYVVGTQQQLLAASQLAVQALQSASAPVLTADGGGGGPALIGASQRGTEESLMASARESMSFLGEARPSSAWAAGPTFTSILARVPYTAPRAHQAAGALDRSTGSAPTAAEQQPADHNTSAPAPLMIVHRCAGCQEVGGDLLVCTQCSEVRHEACGGPHPPEPSSVDGRMPTVNVCRRCAKELNLSSSSSSLRSSTSSSERAALDEYFSSDSDDDSSLSGFIVRSSEEDEEEAADEEAEARERSSEGASSHDSAEVEHGAHGGPHSRRHPEVQASPRNGKGKHTAPAPHQRGGRAKERRDEGDDSAADTSSSASRSASQIWSRSASLDRALAAAATSTKNRKDKKHRFAVREEGKKAADKRAPATTRSAARRGAASSDASDSSDAEEATAKTSTAGKRQRREEAGGAGAGATSTPPTKRQRRLPDPPAGTSGSTKGEASPAAATVKARPRPAMVLEEEELGLLGLSKPSPARLPKRKSGDTGGRRSVVNLASSSSSSDSDGD